MTIKKPAGKLAFAYATIAKMEARIAELEAIAKPATHHQDDGPTLVAQHRAFISGELEELTDQASDFQGRAYALGLARGRLEVVAKSQGEPVSDLIALDRSYRNGLMAGFQFGITADEKGYAACVSRYNADIQAAKAEQSARVAVMLPGPEVLSMIVTRAARQADLIAGANYHTAAELAADALLFEITALNTK